MKRANQGGMCRQWFSNMGTYPWLTESIKTDYWAPPPEFPTYYVWGEV